MIALDRNALPVPVLEWVGRLADLARPEGFYLAGGAAVALYCGPRPVRHLDLMSGTSRLRSAERRDRAQELLARDPALRVVTARDGFLHVRAGSGVAIRWYWYPYPIIEPSEELDGLAVASIWDLGLMKLAALVSRGTRRDLADLYLLTRRVPLVELFERSLEKFGHVEDFPLQAAKALADFEPDPEEAEPDLGAVATWPEVEAWAREELRAFARQELGVA